MSHRFAAGPNSPWLRHLAPGSQRRASRGSQGLTAPSQVDVSRWGCQADLKIVDDRGRVPEYAERALLPEPSQGRLDFGCQ